MSGSVVSIACGLVLGAAMLTGRCLRHSRVLSRTMTWWAMIALIFGIVRNIGVWPFLLLAPHQLWP